MRLDAKPHRRPRSWWIEAARDGLLSRGGIRFLQAAARLHMLPSSNQSCWNPAVRVGLFILGLGAVGLCGLQPLPLAAQQGPKKAPVGELGKYLGHKGQVNSVAISPDEKQLVSCGLDGTVRIWEVETGKEIKQHKDHTEIAWC